MPTHSDEWECRFPMKINLPEAKRVQSCGGFKEIRHKGALVDVTDARNHDLEGENFRIVFPCKVTQIYAAGILKNIGGLLSSN